MRKSTKEMNKQPVFFFEKYSFIAKSTFEVISTDVHVLHCITDSYGRSHRTSKLVYAL